MEGLLDREDIIGEYPRDGISLRTEDMCGYLQPPQAQAGDVDMSDAS